MSGFWRNWWSTSRFPAEIQDQLAREHVLVMAERASVVRHFSGHVPGVFSSASATRFRGAFALTATRVVATLPTGADPRLMAIDSPWYVPRGAGRVTIGPDGLLLDVALHAVDPAFSGSMSLKYKHAIADDLLGDLPSTQLWCAVDPLLVYRAVGVRPKK